MSGEPKQRAGFGKGKRTAKQREKQMSKIYRQKHRAGSKRSGGGGTRGQKEPSSQSQETCEWSCRKNGNGENAKKKEGNRCRQTGGERVQQTHRGNFKASMKSPKGAKKGKER